ncbi:MAG: ribose 5-phosphate isomerase B [Desulfovibrio sp.]|jgi:ribose 5-phosphate isomerase B|nr:ribose 5-phosphate isomerase B [Desulfovibrio sp.]
MPPGTLFIASDHAGVKMKAELVRFLENKGWKVEDLGAHSSDSVDYPEYAHRLCAEVLATGRKGILICGTGIGMCMAANRHKGIRAALCTHEFQAKSSRGHNDANVLCLAERITAPALACVMADIFLQGEFEGGRHQRRVERIEEA